MFERFQTPNASARRCLVALFCHALIVAWIIVLTWQHRIQVVAIVVVAGFYVLGVAFSALLRCPHRSVGLLPVAAMLTVFGFLGNWIAPGHIWPMAILGLAGGLAHAPPRAWPLLLVPDGQRLGSAIIGALIALLGFVLGMASSQAMLPNMQPAVFLAVAVAFVVASVPLFFRELFEQSIEFLMMAFYPVTGFGPGVTDCPTRGPTLVIANHCAWMDPAWVAKVIPLQLRPLMVSRFFDLPVISLLMRRVFFAIRVPDSAFRREAPEVQDAVAALERGENVLIFPEGWLKRREEQSLRRFGQGVYQILREKPRTPVIACWIEGSWGSYTSFFNGPPTKNKKMDFLRPIQVGIAAPEVLSLELLHDNHATRRYLMQAVLQARQYIGLEVLPPPAYLAGDDETEAEAAGHSPVISPAESEPAS